MLAPAGYILGAVASLAIELLRESRREVADELIIKPLDFTLALLEELAIIEESLHEGSELLPPLEREIVHALRVLGRVERGDETSV
jgi:hypothetical protein